MRNLIPHPGLALVLAGIVLGPPAVPAQEWNGEEEAVNGVLHVRNPASGMLPAETIGVEELWRIGGHSEADEEFFGVISDIIIDEANRVYLLDLQLSEVRVFDETGAYVTTMGREGEGPGEFRRPINMHFFPDGGLGVIQAWPSKMVLFDADGSPGGEFPFKPEGEGFAGMNGAAMAGENLALVYSLSEPAEGRFTRRTTLALVDAAGKEKAALRTQESAMDYSSSLCVERDWNGFERCWSAARDGRVFVRDSFTDYAISVFDAGGNLERVIHRAYPPHLRKKEDVERIEKQWAGGISRWVQNPTFDIEESWNPIEDIHARDDGSIWVRTSRGARDLEEGTMARFDVFDREGRYVQEIVLGGDFDSENDGLFIDGAYAFVVTDLISAARAFPGGAGEAGGDDEEVEEDPEPMSVICYRMEYGAVVSR